jgi:hypothetical protein
VQPSKLPTVFDLEADQALPNRVYSAWTPTGGVKHLRRPLLIHERRLMAERVQDLRRAVVPYTEAQKDVVAAAIADMLGGFRSMRQSGDAVIATVASVLFAVEHLPPWAIVQGCEAIRQHRAGLKAEWAPNDTEIVAVCRRFVEPYATRLRNAEALLKAPVDDADGRSSPRKQPPVPGKLNVDTGV